MVDDLTLLLRAQHFAVVDQQIFAEVAPTGVNLPYVLTEGLEGTDHLNTLDGGGDLEFADVDVVVKCSSPSQAKEIATKLIKPFIRDYVGAMGTAVCKAVLLMDAYAGKEQPVANGPWRFTYTLSLNVQYVPA
ncbi:MAG: hypothetical protein V4719_10090 [Planctomycetota bacterium]